MEGEHQNKYELLRIPRFSKILESSPALKPQCKAGMSFVINQAAPLTLISGRFRETAGAPERDTLIELSLPSLCWLQVWTENSCLLCFEASARWLAQAGCIPNPQ
jgi:hypothetical protein